MVVAKVARALEKATDGVRGCLVQVPMAAILMMVLRSLAMVVPFPAVVPISVIIVVHMLQPEIPNTGPSFEVA